MFTIQVIFFSLFPLFFFGLPISGILFPDEPISERWIKVPFLGYVGRAWHDQCNHMTIAQFLADYPFSTSSIDLIDQPDAQRAVALKNDRIGQAVYHALVLPSANSHAKSTFEVAILIYLLLAAIAVFWIASSFYSGNHVLTPMFWAEILPALTIVHLEHFPSQALGTLFLLILPFFLQNIRSKYSTRAIIAAVSIDTEFLLLNIFELFLILSLQLDRYPGPSLPEGTPRTLEIFNSKSKVQVIVSGELREQNVDIPIYSGRNETKLRVLEKPTLVVSTDPRTLLVNLSNICQFQMK